MKCPQKYHELSLAAVLSLALVAFVTFAGEVAWHCGFVVCAQENLDNPDYLQLASIVRAGGLVADVPRHFWGFPAAIASLASLLHVSDLAALLVLSITTSLLTTALVWRLYGPWIAGFAIAINPIWLQASVTGASEPLFSCLVYGALLAWHRDRPRVAGAAAMISATVRPVGVLAFACFAALLAKDRRWRELAAVGGMAVLIGAAYAGMVWWIAGDPLVSVAGYRANWGAEGFPFTWPFQTFVPAFLSDLRTRRWTVAVLEAVWVVLPTVAVAIAWGTERGRTLRTSHRAEIMLLSAYMVFFWCYTSDEAPQHFGRFILPVLPIVLLVFRDWLPRSKALLWSGAVASALVAAAQMVGFPLVFRFRLP